MKKTSLDTLNFLREKRYLDNVSETTLKYYGYVFNRWEDYVGEEPDAENIKTFVIKIRESGVSVFTANSYIRGFNSYLSWKGTDLRIKKLKEPEKVLKLFSEAHMRALLAWRPSTSSEKRLYAMICLALDCGCRIAEILSLRRDLVDFENLLITVKGKGDKERILPISLEVRKVLFRYMESHDSDWVFPDRNGPFAYRAAHRQFEALCTRLGIRGVRKSFHTLRHTFASSYVRDGGNVLYLQKLLGHSDLNTTRIYVKPLPADLGLVHRKTSLVSRFR